MLMRMLPINKQFFESFSFLSSKDNLVKQFLVDIAYVAYV